MLDLVGMLRNECAVVMDTRKRKVVFIVTAPVNVVEVAGVQLDVARPARGGELGDAQAVDLRPMLVNALNLVLTSTQPLRDVVAPWISRRCSSSNVDWALIDELVAWLTMRFMPQPEAARTAAGQHMSRGLPPAYIDQALGTERVPLPAAGQVFGSYFHEDAVTYTDNTFVEFGVAIARPALRLGTWGNDAELATGTGVALFEVQYSDSTRMEAGTALAIDDIERVLFRRRCYEEWKRVSGLAEQIAVPAELGEHEAFWDVIINGEPNERFSGVSEIGSYTLSMPAPDAISWDSNRVQPLQPWKGNVPH